MEMEDHEEREGRVVPIFMGSEVALPHLQKLLFTDECGSGLIFWRHIRAPPELAIYIKLAFGGVESDLPTLFKSISRQLGSPSHDSLCVRGYTDEDESWLRFELNLWGPGSAPLEENAEKPTSGVIVDQYPDSDALAVTFTPLLTTLVPKLHAANIRHLDVSEDGDYVYNGDTIKELRSVLMVLVAVERLMVNAKIGQLRVLEGGTEPNDKDGALFPMLRHLIVHRPSESSEIPVDTLKDDWAVLHRVLEHRVSMGLPIPLLTLSGWMEFLGTRVDFEALKNIDAEGLRLSAELVDKMEDRRVWREVDEYHMTAGVNPRRVLESYRT